MAWKPGGRILSQQRSSGHLRNAYYSEMKESDTKDSNAKEGQLMEQLELGDIIVFKAEPDDWLSKSIAWFSGSDTSHAAMLYYENAIVEMVANGVCINGVSFHHAQEAYVMRLKHAPAAEPLLAAADAYRKAGAKYDFPALFLLAGLFIFRKIMPNHKLMVLGSKILMLAITQLDHFINYQILQLKEPVMVCSQFVYQVYYDCGPDYRIDVDWGYDASDANKLDSQTPQLPSGEGGLCLADYLTDADHDSLNQVAALGGPTEPVDEDRVLEQFYHELTRTGDEDENNLLLNTIEGRPLFDEALRLAETFLNSTRKLLEVIGTDIPLSALFVTPGDFVYHSRNLETVMLTGIERNK